MNQRSQMNGSGSSNTSRSGSSSSSSSSSSVHDRCREPLHASSSRSSHEKNGTYTRWIRGCGAVAAIVALVHVQRWRYDDGFLSGTPDSRMGRMGSRGRPRKKGSFTTQSTTTLSLQDKSREALASSPNFQVQPRNNTTQPYRPLSLLQLGSLDDLTARGVVHSWNPNTALRANPTPETPWNVVVLGGSSASRPADSCESLADPTSHTRSYTIHPNDPASGRYSNLLQQGLRADGFYTNVQNMAQGSTTSIWSAVMIDQLLPPEEVDLIVWDHAINDHAHSLMATPGGPHEMLHFFLTRLRVIYQSRQQSIPPI